MKLICAGLCDYIDDSTGNRPVFRTVCVGHHFEFLHFVDDGWNRIHTVKGTKITQTIREEVIASVTLSIDGGNHGCLINWLRRCILPSRGTALSIIYRRYARG